MTTDNRTNEPSEERLLAALNAYQRTDHEQNGIKRPYVYAENLDDWGPQTIARMRAALTAAGDAPQEPSEVVDDAADEQVEAAAKALFTSGKQGNVWIITHGKPWEETWSEYRKAFRESARAALGAAARAAQGAAPQAECPERP